MKKQSATVEVSGKNYEVVIERLSPTTWQISGDYEGQDIFTRGPDVSRAIEMWRRVAVLPPIADMEAEEMEDGTPPTEER